MNKPILSICIPTYCRAHYLKDCLRAITLQFDQNPLLLEKVEVVISDNASTDNTTDVVVDFQSKYANVKYFRNPENLGCDENYINSVANANGRYAWLIGDDDFIINGAIDYIVNYSSANSFSALSVDSKSFTNMENVFKRVNDISDNQISSYTSHDEYFQRGYCIGVLCAMIFDRELWLNTDRTDYDKGWSYYEIALKMIADSPLPKIHLSYSVIAVKDDCAWVKNGTELFYFVNSNIVTEKMIGYGYDKKRMSEDLIKNSKRLPIILLRAKGHGLNCDVKNLEYIYANLKRAGFWRLLLATLIYFIPNTIVVWLRDFKKNISKKV